MKFSINHNKLNEINGIEFLEFPNEIENKIEFEGYVVILFKGENIADDLNIVCYNFAKQMLWKIAQPVKIHDRNYFTSIYKVENKLFAYSISGVEYQINTDNGFFFESDLIK